MSLWPSKQQWKRWSLPARLTAVGALLGLVSILLTVVPIIVGSLAGTGRAPTKEPAPSDTGSPARALSLSEQGLRISYLRLNGTLVLDRALRGFGFSKEEGFGSKPYWLKNGVYSDLESLVGFCKRETSSRRRGDYARGLPYDVMQVYAGNSETETLYKEVRDYDFEGSDPRLKQQLEGSLVPLRGENRLPDLGVDALLSRIAQRDDWTIVPAAKAGTWKQPIEPVGFYFLGAPNPREALQSLIDPISRAILSRESPPRDIVLAKLFESWGSYGGHLLIREISLLSLDIENTSNSPVELESLYQRELSARPLDYRTPKEQAFQMERAKTKEIRFPVDVLLPGEHLLVPLQIEFRIGPDMGSNWDGNYERILRKKDLPDSWWVEYPGNAIEVQILRGVTSSNEAILETKSVPKRLLEKKTFFRQINETYLLASAIEVEQVSISSEGRSVAHPVRRFDPLNVLARGGYERGSCPILYAVQSGRRIRIRPVIPEAVTRTFQALDHLDLPRGVEEFVLVEEEDEVSFLDYLSVQTIFQDGTSQLSAVSPIPSLASSDGHYYPLRRGDEVSFRVPGTEVNDGRIVQKHRLIVSGFYVPIELRRRSGLEDALDGDYLKQVM